MPVYAAPAKLNLALSVGSPIPPGEPFAGYHPIASWMARLELADEITIDHVPRSSFAVEWADGSAVDWDPAADLACRAHRALEAAAGGPLPADIRVRKFIPAGGGLGGGSSDAATVLMALDALFGLGLGVDRLRAIALSLGSDIPFFVDPDARAAVVSGVGDRVEPLDPARPIEGKSALAAGVVLILPPFGCPTGEVYRALRDGRQSSAVQPAGQPAELSRVTDLARRGAGPDAWFNDLATAAERVRPDLYTRHDLSRTIGCPVHVSGSGSTLFVPVPDESVARRVVDAVPEGWRTVRSGFASL